MENNMRWTVDYSYDPCGRLTACSTSGEGLENYAYDAAGNLIYRGEGVPPPVPAPAAEAARPDQAAISPPGGRPCACGRMVTGAFCPGCGQAVPVAPPAATAPPFAAQIPFAPPPAAQAPVQPPPPAAQPAFSTPARPDGGWTCPACGQTNTGKFCTKDGTPRPAGSAAAPAPAPGGLHCQKCGQAVAAGVKFCKNCGTRVS